MNISQIRESRDNLRIDSIRRVVLGNLREPIDQDNGEESSVLNSLWWKKIRER